MIWWGKFILEPKPASPTKHKEKYSQNNHHWVPLVPKACVKQTQGVFSAPQ